jgi:Protein of unknown function (DUF3703)
MEFWFNDKLGCEASRHLSAEPSRAFLVELSARFAQTGIALLCLESEHHRVHVQSCLQADRWGSCAYHPHTVARRRLNAAFGVKRNQLMSRFGRRIFPYVQAELQLAALAELEGKLQQAFTHLERAHVLGQNSTLQHVRVHYAMLCWAFRHRKIKEVCGQLVRIVGAATKTALGLVPKGNTGGSNVSPFKRLPVAPDLEACIREASP